MKRLLRRALEDASSSSQDDTEQTIVMKGSLSEVYTKALDVAYAKEDPAAEQPSDEDVAVMESQQMDVAVMKSLAAAMADTDAPPTSNFQTVFGVSRDDVTDEVLVEITQELAQHSAAAVPNSEFVLIIDGTTPGPNGATSSAPVENIVQLETALEAMVVAHKGKVFRSLKDYAASRK